MYNRFIRTLLTLAFGAAPFWAAEPDAPAISDGVYSLRWWTVQKGSFPKMLRVHQAHIMPFYERLGVRYLGFWVEIPGPDHAVADDHDKVYMLTRYDSIEHWRQTRAPWAWGESDEDFLRMAKAIGERRSYVIEEHHQFLSGYEGATPPRRWRRESGSGRIDSPAFVEKCGALEDAAYCGCVDERFGETAGPWARPVFLSWLRASGSERPELTSQAIAEANAACVASL